MNRDININGKKYLDVSTIKVKDAESEELHSYFNADEADIQSSDVMLGKVGFGKDGKVVGSYIPPNNIGEPIEANSEEEFVALITVDNIDKVVLYNGDYYRITEIDGSVEAVKLKVDTGSGASEPTFKYTLTEVVADPTKTDWNCFWFDDYGFQSDTERKQFQGGTYCTANGSTQNLMYFTLESGISVYLNAYYGTWQTYGFTGNGGGSTYCLRRYGSYNHNYYKFFPFSSPIASITLNGTWLTQSETARARVTDHIYCGVI